LNAVEIEEAISQLAEQVFDRAAFAFQFLDAFGNKATTIKRLKSGSTNSSDIEGSVLQRNNIHIAVCAEGEVEATLGKLKDSPATGKAKAKFILATDGNTLEAEDLNSGETVACDYPDFPNHFGFSCHWPASARSSRPASWTDAFPWVNGGLFTGGKDIPRFSRPARSYRLHAGKLDWKEINPDTFGSMIQAVADDEERGELGNLCTGR